MIRYFRLLCILSLVRKYSYEEADGKGKHYEDSVDVLS
jgi:hypothetical protein